MTILSTLEVLHMTSVFHVFKTTEHNLCPSKFISFIEQSYTIHWFVFDWVRMPNSIKNNPMDFVLICFIEFDWFGNWTRTQFGVRFGSMTKLMYRSIPKPPIPPPANPGASDFFEKFWSNSPLCCQFRWSKAPPVWASKRVKFLTLQAC